MDRLNPLLEPNGVLLVNECGLQSNGQARIIIPHKDFRIFFTMNPKFGEISRAMRNRCIEISIFDDSVSVSSNVRQTKLNDIQQLLILSGIKWAFVRQKMIDIHTHLLRMFDSSDCSQMENNTTFSLNCLSFIHSFNNNSYEFIARLLSWARLLVQQLEQGIKIKLAMNTSFIVCFCSITTVFMIFNIHF